MAAAFDIPDLGVAQADSHAHLDMLDDPVGALERAALAGLGLVVTIVYPGDPRELASIGMLPEWRAEAEHRLREGGRGAEAPRVALAVGCHPHEAKDFDADAMSTIERLVDDGLAVAVGETGLDFHYDHSPRDDQRRAFRAQLAFARAVGLPAIVHLREAHEEGYETLVEVGVPEAGCVIHCFGEDADMARRFLDLGCYVSFAGTVTFKKAVAIREAAAAVPLDRLLVETDCPFLAPEPYRGRKNEPALSVFCTLAIAEAKGLDAPSVARAAHDNAAALFGGAS